MEMEIKINTDRKSLEEIYYKDEQHKYSKNKGTRKVFFSYIVSIVVLSIVTVGLLIIDLRSPVTKIPLASISILLIALSSIMFYNKTSALRTWKADINKFINQISKIKDYRLIVDESTITIINDDNEVIEKWSNFYKAEIASDYVTIFGQVNYSFFRTNMGHNGFEFIKELARKKIK